MIVQAPKAGADSVEETQSMVVRSSIPGSAPSHHQVIIAAIGARVRGMRTARKQTLQELSQSAGVSESMLSLIERGKASASIGTLFSIATALGVKASDLLDGSVHPSSTVIAADEQPNYEIEPGVLWRVVRQDRARGIEIVINEYEPGTSTTRSPIRHNDYEYGIVLSGTLTVEVDGVSHVLKKGDTIAYNSQQGHRMWNDGRSRVCALWIITSLP